MYQMVIQLIQKNMTIKNWTVEKIKKIGGDAVKVLAWYRPDADQKSILHQKKYIQNIGKQCEKYDIPLLPVCIILYPSLNPLVIEAVLLTTIPSDNLN